MGEAKRKKNATPTEGKLAVYGFHSLAVIVERGLMVTDLIPSFQGDQTHRIKVRHIVQKWLDDEENTGSKFLVAALRNDGWTMVWYISNEDDLLVCMPKLIANHRARRLQYAVAASVSDGIRERLDRIIHCQEFEADDQPIPVAFEVRASPIHGKIASLQVPRKAVERLDVADTLMKLDFLVKSSASIETFCNRLLLSFDGYDADPREVFEISEVRAFIKELTVQAPWWIVLPYPATYITWLASLSRYNKTETQPTGMFDVQFNHNDLMAEIESSIVALGMRCADVEMPLDDVETISHNVSLTVGAFLEGRMPPGSDFITKEMMKPN